MNFMTKIYRSHKIFEQQSGCYFLHFIRKLDRIVLFGSYMGILLQRYERMRFSNVQNDRKMGIEKDESCRQNFCRYV